MSVHDPLLDSALQEAGWLGRLARSLVKDVDRAEDVVQETLVVALESAGEARSSPRGWLGAILRNQVRQAARARGRREAHERRVEPARDVPSAQDVNERLELQALLLDAVRALEEPYRVAIVARFFDGLPPREIARREGVPVRTVNTRLERGLAKLRARLDVKFGGERSAWLAALLPLAESGPSWPWRLGEGMAMGAMLKGSAAVVVVAAAFWFGRTFFETEGDASQPTAASAAAPILDDPARAGFADSGDADASQELASASAPPGRAAVATLDTSNVCRIRVVSALTKAPVPGARVWLQREDVDYESPAWKRAMRQFNDAEPVLQSGLGIELEPDEHGEFWVPRPAKELLLVCSRGDLHGEETLARGAAECVIEMKAYRSLAVEVVDRSGLPVEGAHVAVLSGHFWTWPTDADGRIFLPKLEEHVQERERITVALAGGIRSEPESAQFTLESAPRDPLRFVAQDLGRIVV